MLTFAHTGKHTHSTARRSTSLFAWVFSYLFFIFLVHQRCFRVLTALDENVLHTRQTCFPAPVLSQHIHFPYAHFFPPPIHASHVWHDENFFLLFFVSFTFPFSNATTTDVGDERHIALLIVNLVSPPVSSCRIRWMLMGIVLYTTASGGRRTTTAVGVAAVRCEKDAFSKQRSHRNRIVVTSLVVSTSTPLDDGPKFIFLLRFFSFITNYLHQCFFVFFSFDAFLA